MARITDIQYITMATGTSTVDMGTLQDDAIEEGDGCSNIGRMIFSGRGAGGNSTAPTELRVISIQSTNDADSGMDLDTGRMGAGAASGNSS